MSFGTTLLAAAHLLPSDRQNDGSKIGSIGTANRVCEEVPKMQSYAAQRLSSNRPERADFKTRKNRGRRQVLRVLTVAWRPELPSCWKASRRPRMSGLFRRNRLAAVNRLLSSPSNPIGDYWSQDRRPESVAFRVHVQAIVKEQLAARLAVVAEHRRGRVDVGQSDRCRE